MTRNFEIITWIIYSNLWPHKLGEAQPKKTDCILDSSGLQLFAIEESTSTTKQYLNRPVEYAAQVIAASAFINDTQHPVTKDADQISSHRILNEPTTASLISGLGKPLSPIIAAYDPGGGAFVIVDLGEDQMTIQCVREVAEKAEIELSSAMQTEINLPFISGGAGGPKPTNMKLMRGQLKSLMGPLIQRTTETHKKALSDAGVKANEVDEAILAGGMTRMPRIVETVKSVFGREPSGGVYPNEPAVIGALIQAGVIAGNVTDILLLDVTPLLLSIETLSGIMTKLINCNTTIPTKKSQVFSTAADSLQTTIELQTTIKVKIFKGGHELVRDNKLLGNITTKLL